MQFYNRSAEWQKSALVAAILSEETADSLRRDSLSYLLERSLTITDEPRTSQDIQKDIQDTFGLSYPLFRIQNALDLLIEKGNVSKIKGATELQYQLTADRIRQVRTQLKSNEQFINKVLDEWIAGIRSKSPEISESDIQSLINDVQEYLSALLAHYGSVRSGLMAEVTAQTPLVKTPDPDVLLGAKWQNRPEETREFARIALRDFFLSPTLLRSQYLDALFQGHAELSFQYIETTAGGSPFGIEQSEQLILLDTNVILPLLGYQKKTESLVTSVVNDSLSLGITAAITTQTKEEFLCLLDVADQLYRQMCGPARPRPAAAEAATQQEVDSVFIDSFLRDISRGKSITWSQFCARARKVSELLLEKGVKTLEMDTAEVSIDRKNELDTLVSKYARFKSTATRRHDWLQYLIVRNWRKDLSQWACWFISFDASLPMFDYEARQTEVESHLAFCMSPQCWATWLRKTTPARLVSNNSSGIGTLAFQLPFYRPESNAAAIVRLLGATQEQDDPERLILAVAADGMLHEEARKAYRDNSTDAVAIDTALISAVERTGQHVNVRAQLEKSLSNLHEKFREQQAKHATESKAYEDRLAQLETKAVKYKSAAEDANRRALEAEEVKVKAEEKEKRALWQKRISLYLASAITVSLSLLVFCVALRWSSLLLPYCLLPLSAMLLYFVARRSKPLFWISVSLLLVFLLIPGGWLVFRQLAHLPQSAEQLWHSRISSICQILTAIIAVATLVVTAIALRIQRGGNE
jgi:hypothetical protein